MPKPTETHDKRLPPCPANGEECSRKCLLRPQCTADPERVLALVDQLLEPTMLAMIALLKQPKGRQNEKKGKRT